ncbi:MAG: STAS domain-containing protein, partial [Cyanobacteria bacterium P01_H01_bin.121]
GVAKAISREHNAIRECDAIVFDLGEVPHLGVTASLALENALKEAIEKGREVFVVGAAGQTIRRLEKLNVTALIPSDHFCMNRVDALKTAVRAVQESISAEPATLNLGSSAAV